MIYTSPTAILDGSKAIRGGIPVCFPQFGKKGPLRQHGFARNMKWNLDTTFVPPTSAPAVSFTLSDTEDTRSSEWPHQFQTTLTITLSEDGNELKLEMHVKNNNSDGEPLTFTTALHSYYTCDALSTVLTEFDQLKYEDNTQNGKIGEQSGDIKFGHEVDRIYLGTRDTLTIPTANISIKKDNLPEAIVWNPYVEKATALSDMPDDGWKNFVCIEPARTVDPPTVASGETWSCAITLSSTA